MTELLRKLDFELFLESPGYARMVTRTHLNNHANIDAYYTERVWQKLKK